MTTLYRRPTRREGLSVEPRLASWDVAGSPGQVRLGDFLDHAEAVAVPMIAAVDGLLAVELTVGLRGELALTDGGRDLDNYLFPLARRLGPARIAAMFGRKVHGPSSLSGRYPLTGSRSPAPPRYSCWNCAPGSRPSRSRSACSAGTAGCSPNRSPAPPGTRSRSLTRSPRWPATPSPGAAAAA
jgi:hypothetical protein